MTYYRVFLRGENFVLDVEGKPTKMGFYTTRFVQANDSESAELLAVDLLRKDKKLRGVLNPRSDPPLIFAEEIDAVQADEVPEIVPGFAFFPADDASGA